MANAVLQTADLLHTDPTYPAAMADDIESYPNVCAPRQYQ
jgi:hypothetical protein